MRGFKGIGDLRAHVEQRPQVHSVPTQLAIERLAVKQFHGEDELEVA